MAGPAPKAEIPTTPGSKALAADLRSHEFTFVGPTTAYAVIGCDRADGQLLAERYRLGRQR